MSRPVITLKNFKTAAFASEETTCFNATVHVDGKPFCVASNEGRGGPNNFHEVKGGPKSVNRALEAVGKRLEPHSVATRQEAEALNEASGMTYEALGWDGWRAALKAGTAVQTHYEAFDDAVDDAVTRALTARDLKRVLGGKVLFTRGGTKDLYTTTRMPKDQLKKALADPNLASLLKAETILNHLDFEAALDCYLASSGE